MVEKLFRISKEKKLLEKILDITKGYEYSQLNEGLTISMQIVFKKGKNQEVVETEFKSFEYALKYLKKRI